LYVNNKICYFKHGKQITARHDVRDLYTNGILGESQFFYRLEMQASIHQINQLKVAPWENIFKQVLIANFLANGQQNISIEIENEKKNKIYCLHSITIQVTTVFLKTCQGQKILLLERHDPVFYPAARD